MISRCSWVVGGSGLDGGNACAWRSSTLQVQQSMRITRHERWNRREMLIPVYRSEQTRGLAWEFGDREEIQTTNFLSVTKLASAEGFVWNRGMAGKRIGVNGLQRRFMVVDVLKNPVIESG